MPGESRSHRARAEAAGNLLQGELLQEKAANLGRLARRLERALGALAEHDAQPEKPASGTVGKPRSFNAKGPAATPEKHDRDLLRRRLLADAGDALFLYVVQREVLGLSGTVQVLEDLGVPREVRLCMAPKSVLLRRYPGGA
jgi:hypothetical protein